jgi:hypothetical protein
MQTVIMQKGHTIRGQAAVLIIQPVISELDKQLFHELSILYILAKIQLR